MNPIDATYSFCLINSSLHEKKSFAHFWEEILTYLNEITPEETHTQAQVRIESIEDALPNDIDLHEIITQGPNSTLDLSIPKEIEALATTEALTRFLFMLATFGKRDLLSILLTIPQIDINRAYCGSTLLSTACLYSQEAIVEFLLKKEGIELNKADSQNMTPLYIACKSASYACVQLLLNQKGIDINKPDCNNQTPLYLTCKNNSLAIVELLLQGEGLDINKPNEKDFSPLQIACENNHMAIVEKLTESPKIDINKVNCKDKTALQIACEQGKKEIVRTLLNSKKINPNQTNNFGWTPLLIATYLKQKEIVHLLLENENIKIFHRIDGSYCITKVSVPSPNHETATLKFFVTGDSIIHSLNKSSSESQFLFSRELAVPNGFAAQWTPVHAACQIGDLEMVQLLFNFASISSLEPMKMNSLPLLLVLNNFNKHIIEFLLTENKCQPAKQIDQINLTKDDCAMLNKFLSLSLSPPIKNLLLKKTVQELSMNLTVDLFLSIIHQLQPVNLIKDFLSLLTPWPLPLPIEKTNFWDFSQRMNLIEERSPSDSAVYLLLYFLYSMETHSSTQLADKIRNKIFMDRLNCVDALWDSIASSLNNPAGPILPPLQTKIRTVIDKTTLPLDHRTILWKRFIQTLNNSIIPADLSPTEISSAQKSLKLLKHSNLYEIIFHPHNSGLGALYGMSRKELEGMIRSKYLPLIENITERISRLCLTQIDPTTSTAKPTKYQKIMYGISHLFHKNSPHPLENSEMVDALLLNSNISLTEDPTDIKKRENQYAIYGFFLTPDPVNNNLNFIDDRFVSCAPGTQHALILFHRFLCTLENQQMASIEESPLSSIFEKLLTEKLESIEFLKGANTHRVSFKELFLLAASKTSLFSPDFFSQLTLCLNDSPDPYRKELDEAFWDILNTITALIQPQKTIKKNLLTIFSQLSYRISRTTASGIPLYTGDLHFIEDYINKSTFSYEFSQLLDSAHVTRLNADFATDLEFFTHMPLPVKRFEIEYKSITLFYILLKISCSNFPHYLIKVSHLNPPKPDYRLVARFE